MRKINAIIVHSTATPAGREVSISDIRTWHIARGFSDIGYHFVVLLDGTIMPGRPVAIAGAHCRGHNANSIGVAYVGGVDSHSLKPADTRTPSQKIALKHLLRTLSLEHSCKVFGHRDFAVTDCPSFDVKSEYNF